MSQEQETAMYDQPDDHRFDPEEIKRYLKKTTQGFEREMAQFVANVEKLTVELKLYLEGDWTPLTYQNDWQVVLQDELLAMGDDLNENTTREQAAARLRELADSVGQTETGQNSRWHTKQRHTDCEWCEAAVEEAIRDASERGVESAIWSIYTFRAPGYNETWHTAEATRER